MPGERHLTPAEDALVRVLADAVVEDLVSDTAGLWLAVRCHDEHDQHALVAHLRGEGREVRYREDAA
jgi:hypothetical protein